MAGSAQEPQHGSDEEMGGMEEQQMKGKGVAPHEVEEEDEEDETSDEEGAEGESELVEDNMEEIDTANILSGGRTRGKDIDYSKVADEVPPEEGDEDDEDYEMKEEDEEKMQN